MKRDYDLVHAEGLLSLVPCSLAAAMRKKPSVATIHDLYLTDWRKMYKSLASFAGVPFEVLSCKMPFDHILTVNSSLKGKMSGILKIDQKKIEILHRKARLRDELGKKAKEQSRDFTIQKNVKKKKKLLTASFR